MLGHNWLPAVVAVHGKKRSGKGTTSEYLARTYGYKMVKFADPLKDMITVLLRHCGLDEKTIERCIESDLKEVPLDVLGGKCSRYAMQTIGTEWRNLIYSDLWVDIAMRRMREHLERGERVVIDDLRFDNEMRILREVNPLFLIVTNSRTADGGDTGSHPSENGLPIEQFDVHLRNEGTFEELYQQIESAIANRVGVAA